MNHFGQNFHFFHWLLFSRNVSKELKRRSLSIRKVANFHKFEHMWYQRKENRVLISVHVSDCMIFNPVEYLWRETE